MKTVALLLVWFAVACDGSSSSDAGVDGGDDLSMTLPTDGGDAGPGISTDDIGALDTDGGVIEPDGGTPPTADGGVGSLSCGGMSCSTAGMNVCCIQNKMGTTTTTCEAAATCTSGITRACDGNEDCAAPTGSCCIGVGGATRCRMTCGTLTPQACHVKTDCPAPAGTRVAACCPLSATLRDCRDFANAGMIPADCN